MQKEKKVRSYQRRTKSGKMITVRAHTAKYEAADKAKEVAKEKGAGEEFEERKKKQPVQLEIPFDKEEEEKKVLDEVKNIAEKEKPVKKKVRPVGSGTNGPEPKKKKVESKTTPASSEPAFTAAEFKEWYRGTGSAADKKVAKALRAQLGRSGYRKLEDEAIDNYTSRGHLAMFKRVSGSSTDQRKLNAKEESKHTSKEPKSEPLGKGLITSGYRLQNDGSMAWSGKGKRGYVSFSGMQVVLRHAGWKEHREELIDHMTDKYMGDRIEYTSPDGKQKWRGFQGANDYALQYKGTFYRTT